MTTTPQDSPAKSARSRPFRVQQYNRALGLVTAVLLLLGFGVLRLLTGAHDTPLVETGEIGQQAPSLPAVPATPQEVHRLRPQTTAAHPDAAAPLLEDGDAWQNRPATYWQLVPNEEMDLAQDPELLR